MFFIGETLLLEIKAKCPLISLLPQHGDHVVSKMTIQFSSLVRKTAIANQNADTIDFH